MNWVFFISICMILTLAKSMPGGWKKVTDLNSPEIQKNSLKAVAIVRKSIDSENHLKLVNVTEAEKQVVAGMNYNFKLIIGPTECKKSENLSNQQIEDCPLQKCGILLHCNVMLWEQAWRNSYKVTKFNCEPGEPSC